MILRAGRIVALLIVTAAALAVMALVGFGWKSDDEDRNNESQEQQLTATPVAVQHVDEESIDIVQEYSGRIMPLEQFTLAFEIAGRLKQFGTNADGQPLDDGMPVHAGQELAQLDQKMLVARLAEAEAQQAEAKAALEQADANLKRTIQLRQSGQGLVSQEDYDARVALRKEAIARLQVVEARIEQAKTNLDYARLDSPVDGLIARRHANVGESLNPQQPVFEIVQTQQVLVVVGVPASQVRNLHVGAEARVTFNDRDLFGKPRKAEIGYVRRVAETADEMTRLFEVEIILDNSQQTLKPGLIATAQIVTDRIRGFRLPLTSVIFRSETDPGTGRPREIGYIFSVSRGAAVVGDAAESGRMTARQYQLERWIEQDLDVIVPELPDEHRRVVVRGQHRLIDGRPVEIVDMEGNLLTENVP